LFYVNLAKFYRVGTLTDLLHVLLMRSRSACQGIGPRETRINFRAAAARGTNPT
jgi:hypothetical protein